jgi:hypothetical protein
VKEKIYENHLFCFHIIHVLSNTCFKAYIYIYIYIYYINNFSKKKKILKSLIHFNQMVVLFNFCYWKCVFNEDRCYSLILRGCVSRDLIVPSFIFQKHRSTFKDNAFAWFYSIVRYFFTLFVFYFIYFIVNFQIGIILFQQ